MQKLTPCLWFDTGGEEAATFYTSVFPNSKILEVTRYGSAGPRAEGMVMTVSFELDGQTFTALNGGPDFTFSEAISFEVSCDSQEEVDRLWSTLSEGGEEGPCGWLKDKFGVSWQIVPKVLIELLTDADQAKAQWVMAAMLQMRNRDRRARERRRQLRGLARGSHALQHDRVVQGVVELVRLEDAGGRDHVDRLRHRAGVNGAVRVGAGNSTDAELEVLRRRLESARLVAAEPILAGEHDRERPARPG
jgi:predicted 3-demethylubiquinone-9 3-methyltransferase (glyoxalase superfamily)